MKNSSNEEQNTLADRASLRAYRAPALLLAVSFIFSGCVAGHAQKAETKGTEQAQVEAGLIPCDTDSDCEQKNDKPAKAEVFYCEAITKAGTRCKRHVNEPGLLCKQHSKMVKEGKTVKTID